MNEERTPYLNLPLPHIDHLLQDDVERLRAALTLLDGHAATTARQWAETLAERDITQARQLEGALSAWAQALRLTSPPMLWARRTTSPTGTGQARTSRSSSAESSRPFSETWSPLLYRR